MKIKKKEREKERERETGLESKSVDFRAAIVGPLSSLFYEVPKERRTRAAGDHCPGQSLPR